MILRADGVLFLYCCDCCYVACEEDMVGYRCKKCDVLIQRLIFNRWERCLCGVN